MKKVIVKLRAEWGLGHWHEILSIPYSQQWNKLVQADGEPRKSDARHYTIVTMNINGLKSKRPEVDLMLREQNLGILGLQETKVFQGFWPAKYQGFTSFSTFETNQPGEMGLAAFVNKSYQAFDLNL